MERHRIVVAVAIAVAPIAGLIGSGCSDDEPAEAKMVSLDPGGTFGAEVSVRVVGRGKISGSIPTSIDCPGKCYVRYTFNSQTDKGASDGITLKATATPGARFIGWTFESEQLGTKAKGPDICSPVKRATSQPGDSNEAELKLPFGETSGSAPPGQEGNCAGDLLKVPVAYKLLARFEDIPVIEAGPEGGDGGDAGSPGTVLFEAPVAGATGGDLYLLSGRLYWRYTYLGQQGIAMGLASATAPSSPQVSVSPTSITRFEGDTSNVIFQLGTNTLGAFNSSNPTTPVTGYSSPLACDAIESYSSTSLFCLSAGTMYSWPLAGGTRTTVVGTVPATTGRNFAVTGSYFWVVDDQGGTNGATIRRGSRSAVDNDGGVITWDPTITLETTPQRLLTNSSEYLFWLETSTLSDLAEVHASLQSSTVYTPVPAESGVKFIAPDPSGSFIVTGVAPTSGVGGKIYRTSYSAGSTPVAAVTGIPNMTGLAADSTYYYWTQNDGRVYRRPKL